MNFTVSATSLLGILPGALLPAAPSYEAVVAEVEKNLNLEEFQADLTIEFSKGGGQPKTWTARLFSWKQGELSWKAAQFYGAREAGTVIRKKGDEFSQKNGDMPYFGLGEGAAEVGIFNTDYSFKDILELTRLSSDYEKVLFEEVEGQYHIVMQAKAGKKPFYHRREMWVDKEKLYPVKMKVFGSTGQLIKTMEVIRVERFGGINFPVEILVTSATRNTTTRIVIKNLEPVSAAKVRQFME
jgi:hypothetical protein